VRIRKWKSFTLLAIAVNIFKKKHFRFTTWVKLSESVEVRSAVDAKGQTYAQL
jgi:hypothetical protein